MLLRERGELGVQWRLAQSQVAPLKLSHGFYFLKKQHPHKLKYNRMGSEKAAQRVDRRWLRLLCRLLGRLRRRIDARLRILRLVHGLRLGLRRRGLVRVRRPSGLLWRLLVLVLLLHLLRLLRLRLLLRRRRRALHPRLRRRRLLLPHLLWLLHHVLWLLLLLLQLRRRHHRRHRLR
jgi:hypothetical protein